MPRLSLPTLRPNASSDCAVTFSSVLCANAAGAARMPAKLTKTVAKACFDLRAVEVNGISSVPGTQAEGTGLEGAGECRVYRTRSGESGVRRSARRTPIIEKTIWRPDLS